ncbi:antibiotic biosynthesis monooxygenase [Levilactobacillus yonginensis]
MLHELSFSFGSPAVLKKIVAENPDRQFKLLANSGGNAEESLQLLDISGQPSQFNTELDYDVKLHAGVSTWDGFYSYNYFTFDADAAKVFDAKANLLAINDLPMGLRAMYVLTKKKNPGDYVLLTIWESSQAFSLWRNSDAFKPFNLYATSANHHHSSTYEPTRFPKEDEE